MKPNEIGAAINSVQLGELRRLQAERPMAGDELVDKRVKDVTQINEYVADLASRYNEGDSKIASVFYYQALSIFCREYWEKGLVYTEPIRVGRHKEEGVGDFNIHAQMVQYTGLKGLPEISDHYRNQVVTILVKLNQDTLIDIQGLVVTKGEIQVTPDFLDWAKLMLESARDPENAPIMYIPSVIERVDKVNEDGLHQIWLPSSNPIADPRHMLEYLKQPTDEASAA